MSGRARGGERVGTKWSKAEPGRGTEQGAGSMEMDKESRSPSRLAVYTFAPPQSPPGPWAPPVLLLISGTPASASLPLLLLCLGFLSSVLVFEKFHLLLPQRGLEVPVLGSRKGEGDGWDPRLCWLTSPFPSDGSESSACRSSALL